MFGSARIKFRQLLTRVALGASASVLALSTTRVSSAVPIRKKTDGSGGAAPLSKQDVADALRLTRERMGINAKNGVSDLVGGTPLVELASLSEATGRRIFAKLEQTNPGGSVKDRAALAMILLAENRNELPKGGGGIVVEGSGGNTGIALAQMAAVLGHKCIITLPNYVSKEKVDAMESFGAVVHLCKPVPFSNPEHFFHVAKRLADEASSRGEQAVWTNQFDNLANSHAHATGTGPELWLQTKGKLDGVCVAAGTGGTVSGLARFLKPASGGATQVWIVDPPGSALHRWVATGGAEMVSSPGSTFTEGIGIGRMTRNYESARGLLDGALLGSDEEAVAMVFYLLQHEGLFVGPSAALNVAGAVRLARLLPEGASVGTVICDSGERYKGKLLDGDCGFLRERGLLPDGGVPRYGKGDLSFLPAAGVGAVRWGEAARSRS